MRVLDNLRLLFKQICVLPIKGDTLVRFSRVNFPKTVMIDAHYNYFILHDRGPDFAEEFVFSSAVYKLRHKELLGAIISGEYVEKLYPRVYFVHPLPFLRGHRSRNQRVVEFS